jgi:hypothetical protein
MKYINNYNNFCIHEQKVLKLISELELDFSINESINDFIKKIGDFFININDSIRNLMLTMMEKGFKSLDLMKKFFSIIIDKIKTFKEKYPILFKTIIITLILLVLLFILCSAATTGDKKPPEGVINAAIGLLHDIQNGDSSSVDDATLMKAQAYLLELKKGNNINVGEKAVKTAETAIKIIQQNIEEFKQTKNPDEADYLVKLAEQGAKLVAYKIENLSSQISSSERVSLGYK